MLVKRDVYFSAVDEKTGEEKLFSTKEVWGKKEKSIRLGDKLHIAADKYLKPKKIREAMIDVLDEDKDTAKKGRKELAKEKGKIGVVAGGVVTGVGAHQVRKAMKLVTADEKKLEKIVKSASDPEIAGKIADKMKKIAGSKAAVVIPAAVAAGAVVGGAGKYIKTRTKAAVERGVRNVSSTKDAVSKRKQDQFKVADGKMTKEEFAKKHGK